MSSEVTLLAGEAKHSSVGVDGQVRSRVWMRGMIPTFLFPVICERRWQEGRQVEMANGAKLERPELPSNNNCSGDQHPGS